MRFKELERFDEVLYLNCDFLSVRQLLQSPVSLFELIDHFAIKHPILFIDEAQRLENPGLLLKAVADLERPMKMIASGSSQLEIRSKIQEHLTGRQFSTTILQMSAIELGKNFNWYEQAIFGSYPQVLLSGEKRLQLEQLYQAYVKKDIVDILQVGKPDILQKLLGLVAHSTGQLINYNQLATDCRVTIKTVQHYLSILEETFILHQVRPFVGNKRTEITSNPIYYFIDNGLRNYALSNFTPLNSRSDAGLLIESLIFQELIKLKVQHFLNYSIHFWRTKSGAEIDFVIFLRPGCCIPIEIKYQNFNRFTVSRGYRSFLEVYRPPFGILLNKNYMGETEVEGIPVHFITLDQMDRLLSMLKDYCRSNG